MGRWIFIQLQSKQSLDFTVYSIIKEMIVNRVLKPGEWIVQSRLSEELGVSRTPLRKALGELEKEGLLEGSPKGWYVKEFSIRDMISVFEIRAVLEGLACRFAVHKLEAADIAYLKALFTEAYGKIDHIQVEAYYRADVIFHNRITELAGDPILQRTIASNTIIATSHSGGLYRHPRESMEEHMAILEALSAKNGELAEQLMRDHIRKAIPLLQAGDFVLYK